jgi:hypothetical protein
MEIRAWVEQRVGSAAGSSGVDAASRSYLFQSKILPDLKREVDRAMEWVGSWGQHPLVALPSRVPTKGNLGVHPLLAQRGHILSLKALRARLSADNVTTFAQSGADQEQLRGLDRSLGGLFSLSNVVEATNSRTAAGYAAARRNLDAAAADHAAELASNSVRDPARGAYVAALADRFRALSELCAIAEEGTSPNAVSGAMLAQRADQASTMLDAAGRGAEASNYSPMESMPTVIGIQQEAAGARALATWLRAYDAIAGRSQVSFATFLQHADAVTGGGQVPIEQQLAILDAMVIAVRAARGEPTVPCTDDFAWVAGWAEADRHKKSMGMFGTEEQLAHVTQYLLPVWVVDVWFAVAQGAVFTQGREAQSVVLVDACSPAPQKAALLDGGASPLLQALAGPRPIPQCPVALPRSGPLTAQQCAEQALRSRPGVVNPRARVRGLALLPAAVATFTAGPATRTATTCLGGMVQADRVALGQLDAMGDILQRYP